MQIIPTTGDAPSVMMMITIAMTYWVDVIMCQPLCKALYMFCLFVTHTWLCGDYYYLYFIDEHWKLREVEWIAEGHTFHPPMHIKGSSSCPHANEMLVKNSLIMSSYITWSR